jgi:outer membrane lipoprotein-sorting protein
MRATIRFGLFVLLLRASGGQTAPDVTKILQKVADTYRDVTQYELESTITMRDPDTGQVLAGSLQVAYRAPDKYRTEMKGDFLSSDRDPAEPIIDDVVTIYNGSNLWAYNPKSNEYRVYTVPNLPRDSRPEDVDIFMGIGPYRHASDVWRGARYLRQESVSVDGSKADCVVIEADASQGDTTLWIDQKNYHVLRLDIASSSLVFNSVKLNAPIAAEVFKFVPPPDARKLGRP